MRDQIIVGWVIDRFDPGDVLDQLGLVTMNVLDQLGLGVGRAGDQDRMRVSQSARNAVEIVLILGRFSGADTVRLVVQVFGRIVRMLHELIDALAIKVKHARFAMIDPNDGVVVAGHLISPRN